MESKRLVLNELQRLLDEQLHAVDVFSDKALGILASTTLFWVIAGALGLLQRPSMFNPPWLYVWLATVVGYLTMIAITLVGILPENCAFPLTTDWDELHRSFLFKDENDCLYQLLSNYTTCIEQNDILLKRKARCLRWSAMLFAITVVLVAILAAWS